MNKIVENRFFEQERALYNLQDSKVINCKFEGEEDGESCLKEARNISVEKCYINLRYPLWHVHNFQLLDSELGENARAAFWYSSDGFIKNVTANTIKSLRNCENIKIEDSHINAKEVGWFCKKLKIKNSFFKGDYPFLRADNIEIDNSHIEGKYSLQYMNNVTITNSVLNTKDAFWHSKNVVVKNCKVNGAYLAWYSENVTFIDCEIFGTQPMCYAKKLKLINCTMKNADLSFEYSDVEAEINGYVESIKNPRSGVIVADSIGEIILKDSIVKNTAVIRERDSSDCNEELSKRYAD